MHLLSSLVLALLVSSPSAQAAMTASRFAPLDTLAIHIEEASRDTKGVAPRFAVPQPVSISARSAQNWEQEGDRWVWRHRVTSPNVVSLNFGFTKFHLPEGAALSIRSADGSQFIRDFTAEDNNAAQELWTPVILTDDVIMELSVPSAAMNELQFELGQVGQGFRTFDQTFTKSGACNIDVACEDSKGWEKEVNSVAVISTGGSTFCTGFMVNNAKGDRTPFFMTAHHCGITAGKAPSLVTYWNYQASTCKGSRDGKLSDFQTGATFLATYYDSDFTLVKLNSQPKPEWNVNYAGWSRADEVSPWAVAIHHPNTDEKAISFENEPVEISGYLETGTPAKNTHIRVNDWDKGTTEPGSSGSPLFNAEHRVIGQLHGGWASCSSQTQDYYGRFHISWEGKGTANSRLKDHLDPESTGVISVDTI